MKPRPSLEEPEAIDWEPSPHDGLLSFHDGKRHWFRCTKCAYYKDRLYHAKMHFLRIHVWMGKPMPKKRAFQRKSMSVQSKEISPSSICNTIKEASIKNHTTPAIVTSFSSVLQKNDDEKAKTLLPKTHADGISDNPVAKKDNNKEKDTMMSIADWSDGIDWSELLEKEEGKATTDALLNDEAFCDPESITQLIPSYDSNLYDTEPSESFAGNQCIKKGSLTINVSTNRKEFNAARDAMLRNNKDSLMFTFGEGLLKPLPDSQNFFKKCIFMNLK